MAGVGIILIHSLFLACTLQVSSPFSQALQLSSDRADFLLEKKIYDATPPTLRRDGSLRVNNRFLNVLALNFL